MVVLGGGGVLKAGPQPTSQLAAHQPKARQPMAKSTSWPQVKVRVRTWLQATGHQTMGHGLGQGLLCLGLKSGLWARGLHLAKPSCRESDANYSTVVNKP